MDFGPLSYQLYDVHFVIYVHVCVDFVNAIYELL